MKWQKNLRILPPNILARLASFKRDDCEAGCVKALRESDIKAGVYRHIGISMHGEVPTFDPSILPLPSTGRYSRYNVEVREIVHEDLPMTEKTWTITSPNFGDPSKGFHDVDFTRDVYQREVIAPAFLPINVELLGHDIHRGTYNFKFVVGRVLNRKAKKFKDLLLADLNLLQENVGNHNVYESGSTHEDYLRALYVNWEILPPGETDSNIQRILGGTKLVDVKVRAMLEERMKFLALMKPRNFIKGTSGFARYFGAQFADDVVVFENLEYGNALYVMTEDWQTLSRKSRTELIAEESDAVFRVPHRKYWRVQLSHIVNRELRKRGHR